MIRFRVLESRRGNAADLATAVPSPRVASSRREVLAGAAAALAAPTVVRAQAWPEGRIVTLIVPFPPGGATDVVARTLSDRLAPALNCRFVVENRPGAAGGIGYLATIKAPPDGSVMMLTSSSIATMPSLYPNRGYDPLRDLVPISQVSFNSCLICVGPSVKAATLKDFIAEAKARPGELTYASSGIGSSLHLGTELFARLAGIRLTHVPYKGSATAMTDILGGRVDMLMDGISAVRSLVLDQKLRALAISSAARSKLAPEVPPAAETVPGFEYSVWFGLYLPAKAPLAMAETVQAAVAKVTAQPDFQQRYAELGIETSGTTPSEFRSVMEADLARWSKVIKELGITIDG